jgi:hypothetical protein
MTISTIRILVVGNDEDLRMHLARAICSRELPVVQYLSGADGGK